MEEASSQFKLLGHDSPLDKYPAPVIPVGRLNGQLVTIYMAPGGPSIEVIDENSPYIKHSPQLSQKLEAYDYKLSRLFAYSAENVDVCPVGKEKEFFGDLLDRPDVDLDPDLRKSMSKYVGPRST